MYIIYMLYTHTHASFSVLFHFFACMFLYKPMLIWLQWLLKQLYSLSFFCLFIVCSWEFILPHENLK